MSTPISVSRATPSTAKINRPRRCAVRGGLGVSMVVAVASRVTSAGVSTGLLESAARSRAAPAAGACSPDLITKDAICSATEGCSSELLLKTGSSVATGVDAATTLKS